MPVGAEQRRLNAVAAGTEQDGPVAIFRRISTGSYVDAVMTSAPVAYWRLDETSGTNADDAIAAFDGTYAGGVVIPAESPLPYGSGAHFDGVDDRISMPAVGLGANAAFSLEIWEFLTGAGSVGSTTNSTLFGNSSSKRLLHQNPSGSRNILAQISGTNLVTPAQSNPVNTWNHVVYTWDGTTERIYVNGVDRANQVPAGAATWNFASRVGAYDAGTPTNYAFKGALDEPAIYSRALTAAEVAAHHAARNGILPTDGSFSYGAGLTFDWDVALAESIDVPKVIRTGDREVQQGILASGAFEQI